MSRRIRLTPHLEVDELERRYRAAKEPHERSWWQISGNWRKGQTAMQIAETTGYSRYWIGQLARRYNQLGPAGMVNQSPTHSHRAPLLLSPKQLAELAAVATRSSSRRRCVDWSDGGGLDRPRNWDGR